MRWAAIATLVSMLYACGDDGRPLPPVGEVTRVIFIGDSHSTTPFASNSFASLLEKNDDTTFPAFAGKDLQTLLPGASFTHMERGGDSFHSFSDPTGRGTLCTCSGTSCPADTACIDTADTSQAMVVVQLGVNDLLDVVVKLFLDSTLTDDPTPVIDGLAQQVRALLEQLNDPSVFPTRPLIVVVISPDPSDGRGDMADIAQMFYPTLIVTTITPELFGGIIASFEEVLTEEADRADALLVDAGGHFSGHGYHYADSTHPDHDASDATIWLQNLLEINARGAHELRRVLWNALTEDPVVAIPTAQLPDGQDMSLPAITPAGWANAVVDSAITAELIWDERTWINVVEDPIWAVGEPTAGSTETVAIGAVGAWLVLDMGENEEIVDGPGADLVVMEQGALGNGAPEPYRVFISNSPTGPWIHLADSRGERAFDIAPSGLSMARYVRLESHAHVPDIMSGFGSPVFPGPEIKGVGAVYPGAVAQP